jgi:hypothetical protein
VTNYKNGGCAGKVFFFKYRVFDKERDEKTVAKKIGGCVEEGTN